MQEGITSLKQLAAKAHLQRARVLQAAALRQVPQQERRHIQPAPPHVVLRQQR